VSISGAVLSNTGAEVTCIEREREEMYKRDQI